MEEGAGCVEGTEATARPALREVRANVGKDAAMAAGKADLRRVDRQLEAMLRAAREDVRCDGAGDGRAGGEDSRD